MCLGIVALIGNDKRAKIKEQKNQEPRPSQMNTKQNLLKQLLWDTNISVEELSAILANETQRVGSFDTRKIFLKCLESYSWFTILEIFTIQEVKELLTEEVISKLRSKALQRKYQFLHGYLHQVI